ncbi:MAG: MFS transporter, partial [Dehalococcoidia bacterium]
LIYLQMPYLTDQGMSNQAASFVFTATLAGFTVSRFIWGFLIERVPARYCLSVAFLARGAGPLLLVLLPFPINIVPALLTYSLLGGSFQLLQSVAFANYYGRRFMGSIQGTLRPLLTIPQLVGPLFLGWLVDVTGTYSYAFVFAGIMGIGAAAIVLRAIPPGKPAAKPHLPETLPAA